MALHVLKSSYNLNGVIEVPSHDYCAKTTHLNPGLNHCLV